MVEEYLYSLAGIFHEAIQIILLGALFEIDRRGEGNIQLQPNIVEEVAQQVDDLPNADIHFQAGGDAENVEINDGEHGMTSKKEHLDYSNCSFFSTRDYVIQSVISGLSDEHFSGRVVAELILHRVSAYKTGHPESTRNSSSYSAKA